MTHLLSLLGGALIGLSATLLFALRGRIAGVSGTLGLALDPDVPGGRRREAASFLVGLVVAGILGMLVAPSAFGSPPARSPLLLLGGGALIGLGTQLGSGCTSGHGVCGVSRLSPRSLVATATFIAAGAFTVWLVGAA